MATRVSVKSKTLGRNSIQKSVTDVGRLNVILSKFLASYLYLNHELTTISLQLGMSWKYTVVSDESDNLGGHSTTAPVILYCCITVRAEFVKGCNPLLLL